jgi:hypothetical protein
MRDGLRDRMKGTNGFASLVVVSLIAIDCGGGSGPVFHTSVQGYKPLSSLSQSEAKALCLDTEAFLSMPDQASCRAAGIFNAVNVGAATDAQIQASCQAAYLLCQSAPADAGLTTGGADAGSPIFDCANAMPQAASCKATVAQYSACNNEMIAAVQNLYPPCDQLTKAKLATFTSGAGRHSLTSGPACTAFQAACPSVNISSLTSPL